MNHVWKPRNCTFYNPRRPTLKSEIIQEAHYYPYGMTLQGLNTPQIGDPHRWLFNGKEASNEHGLGWQDFGARRYDAQIGRWLGVDALADLSPDHTPYRSFFNNPLFFIDPDGNYESSHTDEDGNVVAVYDDGDNGVYKHDDLDEWNGGSTLKKSGEGIERVGETAWWDEFISPEKGDVLGVRVNFGKNWNEVLGPIKAKGANEDLSTLSSKLKGGGEYDIKKDYPNEARLLHGKYVTNRSAGNYLAGYLAANSGGYLKVDFEGFQRLAGALHVLESRGEQIGGASHKAKIISGAEILGKSYQYGPFPAYGEIEYQYRMSRFGWKTAAGSTLDFQWFINKYNKWKDENGYFQNK